MGLKKKLANIVLMVPLAFNLYFGCGQKTKEEYQMIKGVPVSVGISRACVAVVLETKEHKKMLGYTCTTEWDKLAKAMALIQSEISDGDTEPIELTGRYVGKDFYCNALKFDDYKIEFLHSFKNVYEN